MKFWCIKTSFALYFFFTLNFSLFTFNSFSQDIHFSQSELSPINLNPAETGNFNADYRVHLNQRTQWRSITVPYVTFSASFDMHINPLNIPGKISSALLFNTDKAGDGHFGTNQIGLAAAYLFPIKDSSWQLRAGLMEIWNQNSVDYSKFYFDNQYNGIMYDPTIMPSEIFQRQHLHYFDIHAGFYVKKFIKSNLPVYVGIALYHINKPSKTFYEESSVNLDRKLNIYAGSSLDISKQTSFLPTVFLFRQNQLDEIYIGGLFCKKTQDISFKAFYLGGWFRLGDAAIISAAMDYQSFHIGISYDVNISPLVTASNGRGGLEIAVRYIFSNPAKIPLPEKHICPTFL